MGPNSIIYIYYIIYHPSQVRSALNVQQWQRSELYVQYDSNVSIGIELSFFAALNNELGYLRRRANT